MDLQILGISIGNIIVSAVILVMISLVILKMVKDKKRGRNPGCGCGCDGCTKTCNDRESNIS